MSSIPLGFAGNKALKVNGVTFVETIQEAVDAYKRWFGQRPDICYVPQLMLDKAIDDPIESQDLAEICASVKVVPVKTDELGGPYAWAGLGEQ